MAPGTARRYYRAASVEEIMVGTLTGWPSKLDDHKPFLHQRWNSRVHQQWPCRFDLLRKRVLLA